MDTKIKLITAVSSIAALAFLSTAIPYANALEVRSNANILGICGVTTTPTTIEYGALAPNATSTDRTLSITNPGNARATIFVKGTDWSSGAITDAMLVSATHYTLVSGQDYDSKRVLTKTDAQLTALNNRQQINTFWQLRAILNDPATVGDVTQTVTLTAQC